MTARLWASVGVVLLIGALLYVVDGRGYDRCRAEWTASVAAAREKRDAELEVARLRGDALSAELAKRERQLNDLRQEYLTYANAITGNCPASLGVLVASASSASGLPQAPGPSPDPSSTIAAAAIAANVATNYPRCHAAIEQLNALIDWHAAAKEALK